MGRSRSGSNIVSKAGESPKHMSSAEIALSVAGGAGSNEKAQCSGDKYDEDKFI